MESAGRDWLHRDAVTGILDKNIFLNVRCARQYVATIPQVDTLMTPDL